MCLSFLGPSQLWIRRKNIYLASPLAKYSLGLLSPSYFFSWTECLPEFVPFLLLDTVTHLAICKDNGIASRAFCDALRMMPNILAPLGFIFPRCCGPRLHRDANEFADHTCFWPPVDTWCVQAKLGVCVCAVPREPICPPWFTLWLLPISGLLSSWGGSLGTEGTFISRGLACRSSFRSPVRDVALLCLNVGVLFKQRFSGYVSSGPTIPGSASHGTKGTFIQTLQHASLAI